MANVGISITGGENISSEIAPRAVEGLRRIEEQAHRTRESMGGGGAGSGSRKGQGHYSEQDYSEFAREARASGRARYYSTSPEDGNSDDGDGSARVGRNKFGQAFTSVAQSAPGVISQLGQGEGLAAGGSVATKAGGILSTLGYSKAGLAGIALGATAMGVNALSQPYERSIEGRLALTAQQGKLGGTVAQNTQALEESLKSTAEAANQFGYSLEKGIEVQKEYATTVGTLNDKQIEGMSQEAFSFARGYGADTTTLAAAQARGLRFGQKDVLGYTAGALQSQGLGPGRFQEQLSGLQVIFEEALSRGVVRGFQDVASTAATFGKIGEVFRGREGAQRVAQLSSDVAGATSMKSEQDILLYRAARSLGSPNENYISTLQRMEKGITPDLLKAFTNQAQTVTGGNKADMVALFQSTFSGLNYTLAQQVVDLAEKGDFAEATKRAKAPGAESKDMQLLQAQTGLQSAMASLGANVIGLKTETINNTTALVRGTDAITHLRDKYDRSGVKGPSPETAGTPGTQVWHKGLFEGAANTTGGVRTFSSSKTAEGAETSSPLGAAGEGKTFSPIATPQATSRIKTLQESTSSVRLAPSKESSDDRLLQTLEKLNGNIEEMNRNGKSPIHVYTPPSSPMRNLGGYTQ